MKNHYITNNTAKEVFKKMTEFYADMQPSAWNTTPETTFYVRQYIQENNLWAIDDINVINMHIDEMIAENTSKITQYCNGQQKLFGYFVGKLMEKTRRCAHPIILTELLQVKLDVLTNNIQR